MADPLSISALTAFTAAQAGMAAVNTFANIGQNNANARAAYDANDENLGYLEADIDRRLGETEVQAQEARSDRVLKTNAELARTKVMAGENGVSGSTMAGMARHLAIMEGVDLGRIENSHDSQKDALAAERDAGVYQRNQANRVAHNQAKQGNTNAILQGVGTGLQIGASHYSTQASLNAAKNKA